MNVLDSRSIAESSRGRRLENPAELLLRRTSITLTPARCNFRKKASADFLVKPMVEVIISWRLDSDPFVDHRQDRNPVATEAVTPPRPPSPLRRFRFRPSPATVPASPEYHLHRVSNRIRRGLFLQVVEHERPGEPLPGWRSPAGDVGRLPCTGSKRLGNVRSGLMFALDASQRCQSRSRSGRSVESPNRLLATTAVERFRLADEVHCRRIDEKRIIFTSVVLSH